MDIDIFIINGFWQTAPQVWFHKYFIRLYDKNAYSLKNTWEHWKIRKTKNICITSKIFFFSFCYHLVLFLNKEILAKLLLKRIEADTKEVIF